MLEPPELGWVMVWRRSEGREIERGKGAETDGQRVHGGWGED